MTNKVTPIQSKIPQKVDLNTCKVDDLSEEHKQKLFKSTNTDLIDKLINETTIISMDKPSLELEDLDDAKAKAKNYMSSILTGDGLETMIAAQMTAVHNLQVSAAMFAKHHKDVDRMRTYVNMVTKLSNTFIQQAQFLSKLQGKGQQKVTVEHVNVHEGGQAIVGNVTNNQGDTE